METQGNTLLPDVVYITHSALKGMREGVCPDQVKACGILIGRRLENEERIELLIVGATGPHPTTPTIDDVNEELRKAQEMYPNVGYLGAWYTHPADAPDFSQQETDEAHGIFAEPAYRVREIINPIVISQDKATIHYYYMNRAMAIQRQPFTEVPGETIKEISDDDPMVAKERQAVSPAPVKQTPTSYTVEKEEPEASSSAGKPSPSQRPQLPNIPIPSAVKKLGMPTIAGIGLAILAVLIVIVVLVSQSGKQMSLLQELQTSLEQPSVASITNAEYELMQFQHKGVSGRIAEKVAEVYVQIGRVYRDQGKLDQAAVSYDHALTVVPGYQAAQQGRGEISAIRNTEWCDRAAKAEGQERISLLESLVLNGFTECAQGPTLDLLYQSRLDYALQLFEQGEFAHADIVSKQARSLVDEFAPSEEVSEMIQVLDILDMWGKYEDAVQENDWQEAVAALDHIIEITGPTPDPASFPAEKYGNRITDIANIRANAQLNYALHAQLSGDLDAAEAMLKSIMETESVSSNNRRAAEQRIAVLSMAQQLWDNADEAMARADLNGVLMIIRQIREIPGFSDLAQNPSTGQTIEQMMRLINVVMIQETMRQVGLEDTPIPPIIITPIQLPPEDPEVIPLEEAPEAAPVEEGSEAAPVEEGSEATPVEEGDETAPVEEGSEATPVEEGSEAAPVEEGSEAAPVEEGSEAAPVEEGDETAPVEEGDEAAPVEEGDEAAPVEEGSEAAPVEEGSEAAPVEEGSEAAPVEGTEVITQDGEQKGIEVIPW